jgi:SAM-dependent methyltransferase
MNNNFIKRKNGDAMLNLGCGKRTHPLWHNIDFSPFAYLKKHPILERLAVKFISKERQASLNEVDPLIIFWDLRRGIPFDKDYFDAVYTSYFLEHLYPEEASALLKECFRVLKTGGIIRVVVPDLYKLARQYISTFSRLRECKIGYEHHAKSLEALFEQMVRQVPAGVVKQKKGFLRYLEKKIRKNASATGETHKWMYDRYTLRHKLEEAGFGNIKVKTAFSSNIRDWQSYNLDASKNGKAWASESLYMEAVKR